MDRREPGIPSSWVKQSPRVAPRARTGHPFSVRALLRLLSHFSAKRGSLRFEERDAGGATKGLYRFRCELQNAFLTDWPVLGGNSYIFTLPEYDDLSPLRFVYGLDRRRRFRCGWYERRQVEFGKVAMRIGHAASKMNSRLL